jgi:hypothetical protein
MADNFGTGTSRVLNPKKTQFTQVVWQQNKPPLDSELNLLQQLSTVWNQSAVLRGVPSGWIGNGVGDQEAFVTNPAWSNWFRFGQQLPGELGAVQWAVVNGWVVPVSGTKTGTPPGSPNNVDTWNKITLPPPPSNSGDSRIDFVFLEVWQALIPPNPGTTNKPSASGIWTYGNVEGGYSFLPDEIIDPALGFETTQRVQVQYRIRVVQGLVGLASFPDGFDPASVKGRGAATTDTAYTFTNMRKELGDPGLWRAGDGTANSLGTVDGYTYAIPLSVVFRRNSVAWDGDPGQNLNGGFNRNPTAIDRTGAKTFLSIPSVASAMSASQMTLSLSSATDIALPTSPATPVYIQVGDEVMSYSSITGTTVTITARGQLGTRAEVHAVGTPVTVLSGRPDGLYSDQIAKSDILDVRHVVNPNGFDYDTLLKGNFDNLLRGQLRANWKRSGGSTQGSYVFYQDKISASPAALGVSKLDAPDGLRQVWSDASVVQPFEFIAKLPAVGAAVSIDTTIGFPFSGNVCDNSAGVNLQFKNNAVLTLPIAQFKNTLPGGSSDQISFPKVAVSPSQPWVKIRLANTSTYLTPGTDYTVVTPTGPNDNLVITLTTGAPITVPLFITFYVQYGSGRGLSRRPNSVHSVAYLNTSPGTFLRQKGIPNNDIPLSSGWAPLWSKFRAEPLNSLLPVTAESYVDPGSKTIILSPFRQIDLPDTDSFYVQKDDSIHGSGVMPAGDPLGMFSTSADSPSGKQNTFVVIPRHLMPGYGDYHVPIIHTDSGTLTRGINLGFNAPTGNFSSGAAVQNNFVAYNNTGDSKSFATFSTIDLTTAGGANTPATYATLTPSVAGATPCGMRFYTDPSGVRQGLELPPYYGPARLWAVYEAEDFATNGSAFDPVLRSPLGSGATNLLRQNVSGPTYFVTLDSDGDSTFVLNAEAVDITRSPNAIANFAAGHYVLEMSVFGFDRGFFDLSDEARLVLPRLRNAGLTVNSPLASSGVQLVIPAPPQPADSIGINFSRTAYQGDAYHSQETGFDTPQLSGPLTSSNAFTLATTELDRLNLTRPNQKVLEVLSSVSFMTTLGTGRLAGDFDSTLPTVNIRNPGYQDSSVYPPASSVSPRPDLEIGGVLDAVDGLLAIGTEYHGCIEHLPLGALHRSPDFRGDALGAIGSNPSPLVIFGTSQSPGLEATAMGLTSLLEQTEAPVQSGTQAGGTPADIIVHVDGETDAGQYSNLTNYRTTRGGSAFVASGDRPGGDLGGVMGSMASGSNYNTVLAGIAYLVRLRPFSVGATEVSAGSELAMLVVTTATRRHGSAAVPVRVLCSTSGSGEGFSAADLYRISGRPLVNDGVRVGTNPATVTLNPLVSLKPRIGS